MPLLKPTIMNDILSTPELSKLGLTTDPMKSMNHQSSPLKSIDDKGDNNEIIATNNSNNQSNLNNLDNTESIKSIRSHLNIHNIPERIPAFGLLMAILSVFCFSIASVIVRILVSLPTIEILVWRSSCQFIVYFITTLVCGFDFFGQKGHRLDLFYRSISGTISLSAVYIAYRLIPLSDASTIHFASPVFVTVFAYFLLKEPLTRLQICTGTITLTGVFIIAKPEFIFGSESNIVHEMRLEGILLSIVAAMTAAFSMIALRKLKTTPVSVVVMWYSFTLVSCGSLYLTIANKWIAPDSTKTWLLLVAIGICGVLDQYCITLAFQYEKAGPISVVRTFNIVLSFIWEVIILNEDIEWTSILGACLICSCVIVLALKKWYKESPESFNRIRRKLCCFCPVPGPSKSKSSRASKSSRSSINKRSDRNHPHQTIIDFPTINDDNLLTITSITEHSLIKDNGRDLDDHHLRTKQIKSKLNNQNGHGHHHHGSNESIDSLTVQNTVNSNAILLIKSDDEDD